MRWMARTWIMASAEAVLRAQPLLLQRERSFQAVARFTNQRLRTASKPFVSAAGGERPRLNQIVVTGVADVVTDTSDME